MFDYTRGVVDDTLHFIDRIIRFIETITAVFYVVYPIVSIATGKGFLIPNCILLVLSSVYLIYFLATSKCWYTIEEKIKRKKAKITFKFLRKLVNLAVIVLAIINIFLSKTVDIFSILSIIFMMIGFCLPFILDFFKRAIEKTLERRINLLVNALKKDLCAPIESVKNVVRKITHKKAPEEKTPIDKKLEKIRAKGNARRARKKAWKKSIVTDVLPKV
jgi:hypothetical protein